MKLQLFKTNIVLSTALIVSFCSPVFSDGVPVDYSKYPGLRLQSRLSTDRSSIRFTLYPTGGGLKLVASSSPNFENSHVVHDFSAASLDPGVGIDANIPINEAQSYFALQSTFREGPLIRVEPGSFLMGSPETEYGRNENENQHEVTLTKPFLMEPMETVAFQMVNVMQWALDNGKIEVVEGIVYNLEGDRRPLLNTTVPGSLGFTSYQPGSRVNYSDGQFFPREVLLTFHPLFHASWHGAVCYANYRSEIEGLEPAFNLEDWTCNFEAEGYRLPTEAEWEYASRAGTATMYNNGADEFDDFGGNIRQHMVCTYNNMRYYFSQPAGSLLPNNWGFYNMAGNGFEWCWDVYEETLEGPVTDPRGRPLTGFTQVARVIRSQTAEAPNGFVRSAIRRGSLSTAMAASFRLVRSVE
jgi:formylglycine-generating enzyme required for sulfatase activity